MGGGINGAYALPSTRDTLSTMSNDEETPMSIATQRAMQQERVDALREAALALGEKADNALQVAAGFGDKDAPAYDPERAQEWVERHREWDYKAFVVNALADDYEAYL
jgi:hypothetical protein